MVEAKWIRYFFQNCEVMLRQLKIVVVSSLQKPQPTCHKINKLASIYTLRKLRTRRLYISGAVSFGNDSLLEINKL